MENVQQLDSNVKRNQSTAAIAGPRKQNGSPIPDERDFCLPLFRQAGRAGINRLHFLHGTGPLNGRMVTQVGRLVHQLEKEGYVFIHEKRDSDQFITYALVGEPQQPGHPDNKVAPKKSKYRHAGGWNSRQFRPLQFGKNDPNADSTAARSSWMQSGSTVNAPVEPIQSGLFGDAPKQTSFSSSFLSYETGKVGA